MKKAQVKQLENIDIDKFQQDLISWFEAEQRELPWRKDKDPYKIWVSEIMLQQTRVDTVIPYFQGFIEQFPTIEALSNAEEERVLKAWEGLGYYSRVRNLQSAVKEVYENYDGKVPADPQEISSLKGVGPYTAGAILSIAYGIPEPAVDGNVMRVLSRILSIWDDIAKASSRKVFEAAVRALISHDNPSYFNQALMELGALICTPTSPSCLLCPVQEHCDAFREGTQNELPVKTRKKKHRHVQIVAAVLQNAEGKFLIHKRPDKGLLANLWEFPNTEVIQAFINEKDQLNEMVKDAYEAEIQIGEMIGQIEHVFSHLTWNINAYQGQVRSIAKESAEVKLVTAEEMKAYTFSVSHQKIFQQFIQHIEKEG
ncbi:A/G-specific adenine glycosylase [Cytobacillus eiseniae]|uniref:Adenine DNA glycosylase n=1 Tax=Cytobacillus eiseniae TaxID=762947 RepID=A0ABS4RIH7_9BACI|nr:A/G-specific adenine glycosylase [Cytobacillus eiseniae]